MTIDTYPKIFVDNRYSTQFQTFMQNQKSELQFSSAIQFYGIKI